MFHYSKLPRKNKSDTRCSKTSWRGCSSCFDRTTIAPQQSDRTWTQSPQCQLPNQTLQKVAGKCEYGGKIKINFNAKSLRAKSDNKIPNTIAKRSHWTPTLVGI